MAVGARFKDASGNVLGDYTTRYGRILGYVDTGTSDGSVEDAGLEEAEAIWLTIPYGGSAVGNIRKLPTVTVVDDTLSWTFGGASLKTACRIWYGIR